ncbi:uncharacterized protein BP5553_02902 [Venustampulla echinocandica]|uniref:Cytochrome P450 n=1 Tax=Venustampulla echinocandica TaxID=2656787 RepID=A0A370TSP6_9HELO|nr:uncharacterized protein BP5553_02902 [Venustampulla echinocandica]RDL38562.1 hypothetical protein BP5553_02902 [Venustampulla echinocandica]
MTAFMIKEAIGLLAVTIVFFQLRNFLRWRALKIWGQQHGCQDPKIVPNKLPWGLERYSVLITGFDGIDPLEDIIRKRSEKMGCHTYRTFSAFNSSVVGTSEPENIQAVLATKFHDFDIGIARQKNFFDMLGNGIFTAEGERWSHYRHQLRPQFTRDQVSDLDSAEKHFQVLLKTLPEENALGWIEGIDIMPFIYRFTMDVSTEFLFGQSVNSQSNTLNALDSGNRKDLKEDMDFAEAMDEAQKTILFRIQMKSFYWLYSPKKFKKACEIVKSFGDRFVRVALDPDYKRAPVLPGQKPKFVLLEELIEETRDPVELRDQILHLLLAGRDTTSALISWTIALLSRHPEAFDRLRRSIIEHFGTEIQPTNELTFTSLKGCKELTYVLHETLRLYPIVPINGRKAVRDTFLPTGGGPDGKSPVAIRKGETVGYHTYVMQRRKDIWGENADEFHPTRWEGRKLGWEMIPFSGGPRVCIGQQYALNEASFVIVKMLQRYDKIEALDMTAPLKKSLSLTLAPGNGVKVKLHKAAS